jgi:hypothetical protein
LEWSCSSSDSLLDRFFLDLSVVGFIIMISGCKKVKEEVCM